MSDATDEPKIKGNKARTYPAASLPSRRKLKCRSKDRTSGLASCKIKGYTRKPGRHLLKATATDKAGLKSKVRKLAYRVS